MVSYLQVDIFTLLWFELPKYPIEIPVLFCDFNTRFCLGDINIGAIDNNSIYLPKVDIILW